MEQNAKDKTDVTTLKHMRPCLLNYESRLIIHTYAEYKTT